MLSPAALLSMAVVLPGAQLSTLDSPLSPSAVLLPLAIVLLGGASAFFSAAETAFFSLDAAQVARLKASRPARAATLDGLLADPRRLLGAILLADTLANVPLCLLSLYFLRHWSGSAAFFALGAPGLRFWLSALALFLLIVGVCDLLPKLLALRNPEAVARPATLVLGALRPVLYPLAGSVQRLGERLADGLTPRHFAQPAAITEDEFENLVQLGAESGGIQAAEGEMIQEIIKLGDKTAKDVMTPRVDAFFLSDDLTNAQACAQLRAARRRLVPIYGETPDDVLGVLDAPRFLRLVADAATGLAAPGDDEAALDALPHYSELVDPPSFVSETMRALDLLRSFLKHRRGLAIIVDEYGGIEGIVTLGDIVEEIIGDALPRGDEALYIEETDADESGRRSLLANGNARLDDLAEHAGYETLPAAAPEGIDTVGGLVFNRLGYVPKSGAVVHLPGGFVLTVRHATRKRVEEVLIEKPAAGADAATAPVA
ncbi:MAG: HlyC/CorC family transporter [Verrucomicrobia bacterium]|nr:HlyC/CorC family transporter [Verrucomicrobiota bacterium]MBV9659175.1 HlyC/CorC family transporter [Verrucomicrobiota bacterium]